MSVISSKFKEILDKKQKAIIPFIMAGDPHLNLTQEAVIKLAQAGADLIEIGIPFSDPMADGPIIQKAGERALSQGITLESVLALIKKVRKKIEIPIILMGYLNPILKMGYGAFCDRAAKAGVNGLIVVDLPIEESEELRTPAKKYNIDLIYLLAPTSDEKRVLNTLALASGFIYYVSLTGVTGASGVPVKESVHHLRQIKKMSKIPVCVGFGIQTPEQAAAFSKVADGVVVGSVLVQHFEKGKSGIATAASLVQKFKRAISFI